MENLNSFEEFLNENNLNESAADAYSAISEVVKKQRVPIDTAIALTNHLMQTLEAVSMNRSKSDEILAQLQETLKVLNTLKN